MLRNFLLGTLAAVLVVGLGATAYNVFTAQAQVGTLPVLNGNGNRYGNGTGLSLGVQDHAVQLAAIPLSDLSEAEKAALLYVYEEEKLARDVYNALAATWNLFTFQNIAASEKMHMEAVQSLLERYALTVPALPAGEFADASLQGLYTTLMAQGKESASQALKVGAAIEEMDILDLQTRLTQTDNADIQWVFTNLSNASKNHLQAFTHALRNQFGEVYAPQYMTAEQYAAALAYTAGNGNGTRGGYGWGGSNGQGNNGQSNGSAVPQAQANLRNISTLSGVVQAYAYGTLNLLTDDGQTLGVQLGNQNYVSSLGFNPQPGQHLTVTGFPGDQGLFTAITITLDDGTIYSFRQETGRPLWAGGNARGSH